MIFWLLIVGAVVLIALLLFLRTGAFALDTRARRALTLIGMGVLPVLWMLGALGYSQAAMKDVRN